MVRWRQRRDRCESEVKRSMSQGRCVLKRKRRGCRDEESMESERIVGLPVGTSRHDTTDLICWEICI